MPPAASNRAKATVMKRCWSAKAMMRWVTAPSFRGASVPGSLGRLLEKDAALGHHPLGHRQAVAHLDDTVEIGAQRDGPALVVALSSHDEHVGAPSLPIDGALRNGQRLHRPGVEDDLDEHLRLQRAFPVRHD